MKKILLSLMLAITTFSMVAEVSARPLGGGRSIGRQSSNVTRQATPPPPSPRPAASPNAAPAAPAAMPATPVKQPSRWKGILGGALVGLGLGALFSHFGLGGALGSMLGSLLMIALLAMAAMFIYRMVRRKDTPANPNLKSFDNPLPAGATPAFDANPQPPAFQPAFQPAQPASAGAFGNPAPAAPWGVPADFDSAAFLRHAKSSFIRMQAAWDKGDTNDLREFTTPEIYAELKMQIQERGSVADFTDVVSIDAQLLGIETTERDYLASVQFNGLIKSAPDASAAPFAEVWNMSKPLDGSGGWVLAGIHQLS
ncbi:MAG: Tim44-like domain-containing protein [Massilia sp.]